MNCWYLYTARLVPIERATRVMDPIERREVVERFGYTTFLSVRPEDVPVTIEHPESIGKTFEVGRVRSLRVEDGWWTARFRLSPEAAPTGLALAADLCEPGRPVSIGFRPQASRRFGSVGTDYFKATLDEVAIVQSGCYPGAEIIGRFDITARVQAELVERRVERLAGRTAPRGGRVHIDPPGRTLHRPAVGRHVIALK